jgi:hypothetical protein
MSPIRAMAWLASVVLMGSAFSPLAEADRIIVRNGSALKGKAIVDEAHPDQYLVFGEKGKTPIILKKERVVAIEPEPSVLDGYAERRKAFKASKASGTTLAKEEFDLGIWCEQQKLRDLASVHFEGAVKRDPTFGPAHLKLGHIEHDGKWLTAAELKTAQGYTLYKGKWLTPEEKEQRDTEASATAEQQSWMRRLAILKQAIVGGSEARARDAETQLLAVHEVAAVSPVVRTFGVDEDPALRKLGARVLASIPGPESSAALVGRLLAEPNDEVRQLLMDTIARSKEPNIVPKLVQGLQSPSMPVINRAAWGLGNLNAVSTVPKLIPALLFTEYQLVWEQPPGSTGPGYGSVMPAPGYQPNYAAGGGQSIPVLTGPVVGPGVVAYGGTSIPAYALPSSTFSAGAVKQPEPKYVPVLRRNVEVWSALVKLTGKDFGYDISTWRDWMSTSYRPEPTSPKRVPQP